MRMRNHFLTAVGLAALSVGLALPAIAEVTEQDILSCSVTSAIAGRARPTLRAASPTAVRKWFRILMWRPAGAALQPDQDAQPRQHQGPRPGLVVLLRRREAARPGEPGVAAGQNAFGQAGVVLPLLLAGARIDGVEARIGAGDVEHAVLDHSRLYAVDARTGEKKWEYNARLPEGILPCCDVVNRGAALYKDKVYFDVEHAVLDQRLALLAALLLAAEGERPGRDEALDVPSASASPFPRSPR
jgi:hypothetical protein